MGCRYRESVDASMMGSERARTTLWEILEQCYDHSRRYPRHVAVTLSTVAVSDTPYKPLFDAGTCTDGVSGSDYQQHSPAMLFSNVRSGVKAMTRQRRAREYCWALTVCSSSRMI